MHRLHRQLAKNWVDIRRERSLPLGDVLVAAPPRTVGCDIGLSTRLEGHCTRCGDFRLIPPGATRQKGVLPVEPQLALLRRPFPCAGEGYIGICSQAKVVPPTVVAVPIDP